MRYLLFTVIAITVALTFFIGHASDAHAAPLPQQPHRPPIDDGSSQPGGDCTNITIHSDGRINEPAKWGGAGPREFCVRFLYTDWEAMWWNRPKWVCVEMPKDSTPAEIAAALGAEIERCIPGVTVKVKGRTIDVYNDAHNDARTDGTVDRPLNDSTGQGDTSSYTEWATYGLTPSGN